MLNPAERDNLTRLIHTLRPDWDHPGILTALRQCDAYDKQATIRAALTAACDDNVRTPGLIPKPGSHWDQPASTRQATTTRTRRPPKRDQECSQHPGEWAGTCRCCAADRLTG